MKQLKKGVKKSKQELQQELAEAQEIIDDQEAQLEKCAKELQEVKGQLSNYEKLQAKLTSAEKQLDSLKDLEKLNDDLKEQLHNSEEHASKQIEKIKKELNVLEKEKSGLIEKVDRLQKEIDDLNREVEEGESREGVMVESIPMSKSSFRIDIYPYQGDFQGKIEHLITKDKKPFKGLDENAIKEFISRHLPSPDENHKGSKFEVVTDGDKEKRAGLESTEKYGNLAKMPVLRELQIIKPSAKTSSRVLLRNQPFEVCANFDIAGVRLTDEYPVEHQITVFANSMADEPRQTIAEAQGIMTSPEESTVKMFGNAIPEGTYRLRAFVTLTRSRGHGEKIPARSYFNGDLFHVF